MTATPTDNLTPADAVRGHWVTHYAPDWLKPYARLARWDRPIGWWLLMWPCWWSAAMAAANPPAGMPNLWHLVLFMVGAIAMRGAGCTYNDIVDREIDAGVERTRMRPIPSGAVSVKQALAFAVAQSLVGLLVLVQFNAYTIALGIASLAVVAVYPFMKRITSWPQFVLGLAFNWGAFLGWTAVFAAFGWPPLLLWLGGIAWTIGYDTIYAHQDRRDDAIIGVRSTARLFAENSHRGIGAFYVVAIAFWGAAFWMADLAWPAFAGLAGAATHMGWQVATLRIDDGSRCLMLFRSNRHFGWILFAGLVAAGLAG
ncbi:4-hydroxybenzoate octaprenyltransferase [Tepidamorphus sp. 3E244]|uniref:4-hydroxybenzoate octaprenyltransferase n=1 Tax=Tepidamorphus sp. 3E244 TaxID=3385498 RepID=UPI0038FBFA68